MWDAEVSQVQLHIGLYAKSSYRGFLVAPYDSVPLTGRGVPGDTRRYEIRADTGRYGEMRGDARRYGEIQSDIGEIHPR